MDENIDGRFKIEDKYPFNMNLQPASEQPVVYYREWKMGETEQKRKMLNPSTRLLFTCPAKK